MYSQISILRHHIYKATEFGADFRELCKRLNLTPEMLSDGEGHLPFHPGEEHDFWSQALLLTGDPCLGLHMGAKPDKFNAFGMLGMLAGSCRTVGEAFDAVSKYNDTLTGVFRYRLDVQGKDAIFEMTPHALWEESNLESARQAVDMSIAGWLTSLHEVSVRKVYPRQTELKYSRRFEEEYQKVVHGPVLFNRPMNCFVFQKSDLNVPLLNYDQGLLLAFEALLRDKQKQLDSRKTVTSRIRHLLLSTFHGQITHIDIVASSLFMTTRTLQRKLSEENTTYRAICNDLRKELAAGLIKIGKTNKSQLATLLGYSDSSTFNKAFRNWQKA
ncbi:MAG TPA: AraC family transcriptional regulator ligand-binding domain-containing protein [Chryseosolibacter sp.]